MHRVFLDKEIRILKNKCDVKKADLWLLFELVTFLTINGEISLYEAEKYAATLFKLLEGARES